MGPSDNPRLKQIAEETLAVLHIKNGKYQYNGREVDIRNDLLFCNDHTRYYPPDHPWDTVPRTSPNVRPTVQCSVLNVTTIECARLLVETQGRDGSTKTPTGSSGVGVLNFASATQPGGGFKKGTQAQEESIARVSSLYASLVTNEAQQYHALHNAPGGAKDGWYTHAMVYSPSVIVFRDDEGTWVPPYTVDVLTSAAVNAREVRGKKRLPSGGIEQNPQVLEDAIQSEMRDRMARVLCLFKQEGVRNIVLGSYGTGVFKNEVSVVANLWADLLVAPGARFATSFDRVMFAIMGDATFREFEATFKSRSAPMNQRKATEEL